MTPRRASAVFIAATLGAGAWHALLNSTPPSFDDGWYLETSFRLFNALKQGLFAFASAYTSAFRVKAPLVSLLPLPLYAVFGPGERIAIWANLAILGAACAAVFAAGRALWPSHPRRDEIAALGASLAAVTPLLYGTSRYFLVEPVLVALVAAAVWRLANDESRSGRPLGAVLGLGLLAKIIFPIYILGPAWLLRKRLAPRLKTALPLAAGLAATWYVFNLPYVLGFAWSAGFGRIAADYGPSAAGPLDRVAAYAAQLFGGALSWPMSAAAAVVSVAAVVAARRSRLDAGAKLALAWAAPLALFALSPNREIRFAAPALPALCLLAARAALSFDSRSARAGASAILLLAGTSVFARQTFIVPAADALPWCGAPSPDAGLDRAGLVNAAAAGGASVAAIALEHPRLNANNLSSLAASRGLPLRFVSLGYAQASAEGALIRLKDKDADRLILINGIDGPGLPAFLNRANAGVADAVASGHLPARLSSRVPLGGGVEAAVYVLGRGM